MRSRQLEGTFPGARETGTWIITSLRVHKGWGAPPETAWPYDGDRWPPAPEPAGIDAIAKADRLFAYERVRSLAECRVLLAAQVPVTAAIRIDASWYNCTDGRIDDPAKHQPGGSHTILIIGYDDDSGTLEFANSWGTDWGHDGFGYLPYSYFEQRLLEAWHMDMDRPRPPRRHRSAAGVVVRACGVRDALGRVTHVIEMVDTAADEMIGWAIAVEISNSCQVEDFFVRPACRGRGNGRELAKEVLRISAWRDKAISLWMSHADWLGEPTPGQAAVLAALRLTAKPSPERWAAAVAVAAPQDPA